LYTKLKLKFLFYNLIFISYSSCATSIDWQGSVDKHVSTYMQTFDHFRSNICVPRAESIYNDLLKKYRGQGYWIPELKNDVDVESIEYVLPDLEKKLAWIKNEKKKLKKSKFPEAKVLHNIREILKNLLALKKNELQKNELLKIKSRQESLRLLSVLQEEFSKVINRTSFFLNYNFPVDHLRNRKMYDMLKDLEDPASIRLANRAFLFRKVQEDGAYYKDHTSSDIYLRTTLDTLYFELKQHDFYLTENARYDLEFILSKMESELKKGKAKILERLTEWEERTTKTLSFYQSLTQPENRKEVMIGKTKTTPNRRLIAEHNKASDELKEFVYTKQAEVYKYWLSRSELERALFVIETILMNEVGGVDGEDALERIDVARVIINRLDKPKYLSIGQKEFIFPYLKSVTSDSNIQNEKWLNALFKQGEFSFTYYYMGGVAKIFCPDLSPDARRLRRQNVEIALHSLKEGKTTFQTTRYFSRASMIGRIHMDTIWEDYVPYPERPGLLAVGQDNLLKSFEQGDYTFLYSFKDHQNQLFQVLQIGGNNYALAEKNAVKLFYRHRNPHYFRYFTKLESPKN
jgi:hypothetical protein